MSSNKLNSLRDTFSGFHPIVNFTYFAIAIMCSMFFLHPVYLVISLVSSLAYSIYLEGRSAIMFSIKYMLPMLLVTALVNPAFNHEGATILCYLQNGNPLTLESIIYGIATAAMLISVITWFACYNKVMTSDKFIYLFGRIIPGLSLIFSMILRFVPKFKAQFVVVSNGQKCMGRDMGSGGMIKRMKYGIKILSIMVTWALENAIETADSMKSRGYGLNGRTAFSIFRFDKRDAMALGAILVLGVYVIFMAMTNIINYRYFPSIRGNVVSLISITTYMSYAILLFIPLIINMTEEIKWKRLQSKI